MRCGIPITTVVLNNSTMAIETDHMPISHERYRTRDIGGDYSALGRAMGGRVERVETPHDIAPAFQRARKANDEGHAVLMEVIPSAETALSHRRAFYFKRWSVFEWAEERRQEKVNACLRRLARGNHP